MAVRRPVRPWRRQASARRLNSEFQRAESLESQHNSDHEAKVADAIDDECFFACVRSRLLQEIEADQQVTAEAHAFPSDEQTSTFAPE